jgi:hypothetical protein
MCNIKWWALCYAVIVKYHHSICEICIPKDYLQEIKRKLCRSVSKQDFTPLVVSKETQIFKRYAILNFWNKTPNTFLKWSFLNSSVLLRLIKASKIYFYNRKPTPKFDMIYFFFKDLPYFLAQVILFK